MALKVKKECKFDSITTRLHGQGRPTKGEGQGAWPLDLFEIILLSLRLSWKFDFVLLSKTFKILLALDFLDLVEGPMSIMY